MKYYLHIENEKINGGGCAEIISEGWINAEITEQQWNNFIQYGSNYYIYSNGEIVENPNYEQEQAQKKSKRIGELTMTALDFITFLRQCGLTLEQIRAYLDNNIELDTQLKYCQNVYCKVARSVMPITVGEITITAEMVENAFKVKNGETVYPEIPVDNIPVDEIPF